MLIKLNDLIKKYNILFKGILHVGAHKCEEITDYERFIPRNKILWVEAIPALVEKCKNDFPDINIEQAVITDKNETVTFNISNNGESSSILELGTHSVLHPKIYYIYKFQAETKLLSQFINNYNINYNFLNLDIQGAELKALKSLGNILHQFDYIYTEVNSSYIYKNCALIGEIDNYLTAFNFVRVETEWWVHNPDNSNNYPDNSNNWGDAFYIKKKLLIETTTHFLPEKSIPEIITVDKTIPEIIF